MANGKYKKTTAVKKMKPKSPPKGIGKKTSVPTMKVKRVTTSMSKPKSHYGTIKRTTKTVSKRKK